VRFEKDGETYDFWDLLNYEIYDIFGDDFAEYAMENLPDFKAQEFIKANADKILED